MRALAVVALLLGLGAGERGAPAITWIDVASSLPIYGRGFPSEGALKAP